MHPTVKIISLCFFAAMVQLINLEHLMVIAALLFGLVVYVRATNFIKLALKVKWLVLTMLCIYGIYTPGEYILGLSSDWAPTYEGLRMGAMQSLKLLCMVAAVALLIKTTTQQSLLAGIYHFLQPLKLFKLAPDRFAVRLWLTLDYVDTHRIEFKRANFLSLLHNIKDTKSANQDVQDRLVIVLPELLWQDYAVLISLLVILGVICV